MEPNVRFWMTERQSFFQRFVQWAELLDFTNLFVSTRQIEKARQLLTNEDGSVPDLEDTGIQEAWNRSLASVHSDSGKPIPRPFRPAALLPLTAPVVFLSLVQVKSLKSIVLPQLCFCSYSAAFNIVNGNKSYNRDQYETILLGTGAIAWTAFLGIVPRVLLMKRAVKSVFLGETLPAAILTQVSALSVITSRGLEPVRGIEVMDKEGNVVGCSRRAGTKAVTDTTISRVALFGTSAFIPEVFSHYFKKTPLFVRRPHSLWALKLSCTFLVMGLMVPVSFSMFPQIQRIECSELEQEIQSATEETELFYHRGV